MKWAIEAFRSQFPDQIPHIITSNIEHCATELPLKAWQREGKIEVKTLIDLAPTVIVVDPFAT